jgi:hypothetical protein
MKTLPLLAALVAAYCAPLQAAKPQTFEFVLSGEGKAHEECMRVPEGVERRYEWTSDAPVDFNIHYHAGDAIFYPVKRNDAKEFKGRFKPNMTQDYCWMWTGKGPAKVRGRFY